jgi:hypothetical protein
MPRTRSSSLEHPRLKFTRPSRHMTSRPSCLMITRPPRLTTTRPPRLMTPRPPRLRLGPAIPMTRSSSLGQALQNSKFLVPVDGSQQTLFRSSPAGTHRTLVRTYFQNPASPSSNFSTLRSLWSLHPYPTHEVHAPSPPRFVVPVTLTSHTHNHSMYGFPPRAPGRQSRDSTRALTRGPSAPAAAHSYLSLASHRLGGMHDYTALAPHDYTALAPHDFTALAPHES